MTEKQLHKQICDYIKLQYPKVIFNTDLSGLKLTVGQASQVAKLRSSSGFPDIQILEPRTYRDDVVENYYGLFLEVKKETPFKKDRSLKKNKHLEKQANFHKELNKRGYLATFVWSFEMAKDLIDFYLNL